jgi:hypothetical protein
MPVNSLRYPRHWQTRAEEMRRVAALTDDVEAKTAIFRAADEYDKLAQRTADWRVGQRVSRIDTDEHGLILEANDKIKVKWDRGRTSYFRRDKPVNVRLKDKEPTPSDAASASLEMGPLK